MRTLAARNLSVRLGGKQILDDIDIRFESGKVTAIVGPNGAGKSTLLSCLCGLRIPDTGCVAMGDAPLTAMPARQRARKIGFIPQNPEVAWAIDVLTLVRLGRTPYAAFSRLTTADHAAVQDAMALTDTALLAGRDVTTLSGGERARAILARTLAGEPDWLIADEPFAGLDPRHQLETAGIFRNLAVRSGKGVIVTLHDLTLAARMADQVIVLTGGKVVTAAPPHEALAPDILATAYGVATRLLQGEGGPVIEIVRREEAPLPARP